MITTRKIVKAVAIVAATVSHCVYFLDWFNALAASEALALVPEPRRSVDSSPSTRFREIDSEVLMACFPSELICFWCASAE